MDTKTAIKLSADLAAGTITESHIRRAYGDTALATVLGIAAGVGVGYAVNEVLEVIDNETGIVSDVAGVVDDVIGTAFSIFD
jgi:hypothetical protein